MENLQRIKSLYENRQALLTEAKNHAARVRSARVAISEQENRVREAEKLVAEAEWNFRELNKAAISYGQGRVTVQNLTEARDQHSAAVKAVQEAKKQVEVLQAEHRSVEFAVTPSSNLPSVTRDLHKAVLDAEMERSGQQVRDIIGRLFALQQGVKCPGHPDYEITAFLAEIFKDGVPVLDEIGRAHV